MIVREYGWHAVPDPFNTMKPIIYRAWLGAMSLMLLTTTGRAQTCLGGASFKQRTAQIGTELSRSANSEATTVGVGLGDTHGTFGSIGLGRVHDDDVSDNATVFSGKAGHGFRLWSAPETELCPFVSAVIVNGVNFPTGEAINYRDYGGGFGLGMRLGVDDGLEVVPFASGAVVLETQLVRLSGPPYAGPDSRYFSTALGVGFVIQQAFTLTPSASFAITHGQTTSSYGLRVSLAFGRVTPHAPPAAGEGSLATVWVNPRAMLYYCSGSPSYGQTAGGSFMTEQEALAAGYNPERDKRCGA